MNNHTNSSLSLDHDWQEEKLKEHHDINDAQFMLSSICPMFGEPLNFLHSEPLISPAAKQSQ